MTAQNRLPGLSRSLLATLGVSLVITLAHAASPVFWRVSTQNEFLKGEVENIAIDAAGLIRLGPRTDVVYETTAPFLWSAAADGSSVWLGSGNDGRVFHVSEDGTGTQVFDADELNVHAVASAGDGSALAGTSPNGSVYRVSLEPSPSSKRFFDPDEKYIWALLHGSGNGAFGNDAIVATGEPGRIYRVLPNGDAILLYDTETTHVMALAFDGAGNLLAGTGSPGRVFRITPDGEAFVILDSEFDEIRSIRLAADGSYYAAAVSKSTSGMRATTTSPTTTSTTVTVTARTDNLSSASASSSSMANTGEAATGGVYHIQPDGVWDLVWRSSSDAPYDIAPLDGETDGILVGTGNDGKIFHVVKTPERIELVARARAQQVTAFVPGPDGTTLYATANPGKLFRLSSTQSTSGVYISDVHDASVVSTWGTLRWHATTPTDGTVRLFTRTGNTDTPNDTWSRWSEPYEDASGSQIASPKARYIQWKAELRGTTQSPLLRSVTTAYLPRNLRPRLTALTVHEPGVVFQESFGTDPPIAGLGDDAEARAATAEGSQTQNSRGRRVFRKGLRTFVWTSQDDNNDNLEYDVLYRADLEDAWHPLATRLLDTIFAWDTTSAPDGIYIIRVVASDRRSNAPGSALLGSRDSAPFPVDNSAPAIRLEASRVDDDERVTTFVVADEHSPIRRVEYSFDMERWHVVYPVDGISDAQTERFELRTSTSYAGRLVLRAVDGMGNASTVSDR